MTDRSGVLGVLSQHLTFRDNEAGAIDAVNKLAELIAAVEDVYAGGGPSCSTPCPSCRIYAALAACRGDA